MSWTKRCGDRLRDARAAKGLSQEALARATGYQTGMTVSNWERGTSEPDNTVVTALAVALDVTAHYLLCRVEDPQAYPMQLETTEARPALDLAWIFTYHPPDEGDVEKYDALRDAAHRFAQVVLENTPPGADQSAAIRKVREAVATANAAVALSGRLTTCD